MSLARYSLVFVLAAVLVLGACEESVDPILDSDRQFTLWGTLDMNADTQFVRVIPIRPGLTAADAPLEATVTSTDLETGEVVVWRDSVVTFPGGRVGHIFYAPLRVQPLHRYQIDVTAPGRELTTRAVTTVPARPEPEVAPESVQRITTPQGARIEARQAVVWRGVGREPYRIEQWYRFLDNEVFTFRDVRLPFAPLVSEPAAGDAWLVNLNLLSHRLVMDSLISLNNKSLAGLAMQITVLDEAFVPPGGVFDPDVLVQPGTLSNVENGFGFVGAVGRFSVEWVISDSSARLLDYTPIGAFNKLPPDARARLAAAEKPWRQ